MPQLELGLEPYECRGLFREHYLGKRFVVIVVLGYSRLLWLQCDPRQTMRTLMRGLETAFHAFGGVPAELLFDELKALILDQGSHFTAPV